MKITVELRGKGLAAFTAGAKNLASPKAKAAARMALNDTGRQVNTQVKRTLVKQTGIKYGAINKGVKQEFATNARLEFKIIGTGKHFGLTDFGARQTKRGVSAAPWAARSAPIIANETGADPTVVFNVLDRLVREHLDQMASSSIASIIRSSSRRPPPRGRR
jgi:hypothetical protein